MAKEGEDESGCGIGASVVGMSEDRYPKTVERREILSVLHHLQLQLADTDWYQDDLDALAYRLECLARILREVDEMSKPEKIEHLVGRVFSNIGLRQWGIPPCRGLPEVPLSKDQRSELSELLRRIETLPGGAEHEVATDCRMLLQGEVSDRVGLLYSGSDIAAKVVADAHRTVRHLEVLQEYE